MLLRLLTVLVLLTLSVVACNGSDESIPETPAPAVVTSTPIATVESETVAVSTSTPEVAALSEPTPTPSPTVESFDLSNVIVPAVPVPSLTPFRTAQHPQEGRLDLTQERTIEIRRLIPKRPIEWAFITRDQLRSNLVDILEEDRDEILLDQKLFQVLRLIGPEVVLQDIWLDVLSENVAGYYHLEEEKLYVITDSPEFTPLNLVTHAHETTHALQQQNYDIHATREALEGNSDAYAAFTALIEGDASIVEAIYMIEHFTEEEQRKAREESQAASSDALRNAPYVVRRLFFFPYFDGFTFVRDLLGIGGWDSVNDAYENPPLSTEHILHIDRFLARDMPLEVVLPSLAGRLGDTWEELRRDTLGEHMLLTYLETDLPPPYAFSASSGWGGDRYSLLEGPDGALALVAVVAWDTRDDAVEFLEAFHSHLERKAGLEWEPLDESEARYRMNAGSQTITVIRERRSVTMVFAPDASVAEILTGALSEAANAP